MNHIGSPYTDAPIKIIGYDKFGSIVKLENVVLPENTLIEALKYCKKRKIAFKRAIGNMYYWDENEMKIFYN